MPLYGKGLRRPAVFRAALGVNDFLSRDADFSGGRLLGVAETIERFPAARCEGLKGGALWLRWPDYQPPTFARRTFALGGGVWGDGVELRRSTRAPA